MKLLSTFFLFFISFFDLTHAGPPPKWQDSPMPYDYGMQRMQSGHAPFQMPVLKDSNFSRRKRLYLRNRMTVNRQGVVIGHYGSSVEGAERFLRTSGATKEAAKVDTIQKHREGWKEAGEYRGAVEWSAIFADIGMEVFKHNNPGYELPRPPLMEQLNIPGPSLTSAHNSAVMQMRQGYSPPSLGIGGTGVSSAIDRNLKMGIRKPAVEFNKRMAQTLGLKDPGEIETSAKLEIPVPPGELDLADLGPDENWKEFSPDYRISRRRGRWFVGEGEFGYEEIASWLSAMGYSQAGILMMGPATNELMSELDKVNSDLQAALEKRARELNPWLPIEADKVIAPPSPAKVPKFKPLSPKEMPDQ